MYECSDKMVSHPSHYKSETGLEVIDVIEAFTFDLRGIEAVDTGKVLKYICRWKKKNGLQDLKKAAWYLEHLIDHVAKLEGENAESYSEEIRKRVEEKVNDNAIDYCGTCLNNMGGPGRNAACFDCVRAYDEEPSHYIAKERLTPSEVAFVHLIENTLNKMEKENKNNE